MVIEDVLNEDEVDMDMVNILVDYLKTGNGSVKENWNLTEWPLAISIFLKGENGEPDNDREKERDNDREKVKETSNEEEDDVDLDDRVKTFVDWLHKGIVSVSEDWKDKA